MIIYQVRGVCSDLPKDKQTGKIKISDFMTLPILSQVILISEFMDIGQLSFERVLKKKATINVPRNIFNSRSGI